MCIHTANSQYCTAETNITLQNNYIPKKPKYFNFIKI